MPLQTPIPAVTIPKAQQLQLKKEIKCYNLYLGPYFTPIPPLCCWLLINVMLKKVCKWKYLYIQSVSLLVPTMACPQASTQSRLLWARNFSSSSATYTISAWGYDISSSELSGEKEVFSAGITGNLQFWRWAGINSVQLNENYILVTRLGQRLHICLSINFSLKQ